MRLFKRNSIYVYNTICGFYEHLYFVSSGLEKNNGNFTIDQLSLNVVVVFVVVVVVSLKVFAEVQVVV